MLKTNCGIETPITIVRDIPSIEFLEKYFKCLMSRLNEPTDLHAPLLCIVGKQDLIVFRK